MHICMYVCVYVCIYKYIYICFYIYMCIYLCNINIYIDVCVSILVECKFVDFDRPNSWTELNQTFRGCCVGAGNVWVVLFCFNWAISTRMISWQYLQEFFGHGLTKL